MNRDVITDAGAMAREIALVECLARSFPRSADQVNGLHESDAELLRLPGSDLLLAITTDAICEEIESGLYEDPYLIGWMAVVASASDLAAVGADPLGLLVSETLPFDSAAGFEEALQTGIADACSMADIPVLGGDTNRSTRLHIGTTAVGTVPANEVLTRRGIRPGDTLFASGPLGAGGAFALSRFGDRLGGSVRLPDHSCFRPRSRLQEGRLVRRFGSACMDSSDGLIPTLDELMRLNRVGFDLRPADDLLDLRARSIAGHAGLPSWLLLAGPHGEFELIFTVPEQRVRRFLHAAKRQGWRPLRLGEAVDRPGLKLGAGDRELALDATAVRDLFDDVVGDPRAYLERLLAMHARASSTPSEAS